MWGLWLCSDCHLLDLLNIIFRTWIKGGGGGGGGVVCTWAHPSNKIKINVIWICFYVCWQLYNEMHRLQLLKCLLHCKTYKYKKCKKTSWHLRNVAHCSWFYSFCLITGCFFILFVLLDTGSDVKEELFKKKNSPVFVCWKIYFELWLFFISFW